MHRAVQKEKRRFTPAVCQIYQQVYIGTISRCASIIRNTKVHSSISYITRVHCCSGRNVIRTARICTFAICAKIKKWLFFIFILIFFYITNFFCTTWLNENRFKICTWTKSHTVSTLVLTINIINVVF